MNLKAIDDFIALLKTHDIKDSATIVIKFILPEAQDFHISLYEAAKKVASLNARPDTVAFRLRNVLETIDIKEFEKIDIHQPL